MRVEKKYITEYLPIHALICSYAMTKINESCDLLCISVNSNENSKTYLDMASYFFIHVYSKRQAVENSTAQACSHLTKILIEERLYIHQKRKYFP